MTTPDPTPDVGDLDTAELRRLLAEATPGPWRIKRGDVARADWTSKTKETP